MPFEKGNTLSTGRPPGSKNKKNAQWNDLGDWILNEGSVKVMKHLNTLDGQELLDAYGNLLNYFKPKHASTTVQAEINIPALQLQLRSVDSIEAMRKLSAPDPDIEDAEVIEE